MKVHIIASRLKADRVLPRLARTLSRETGWTLSERPRDDVDLNYFLPYIDRNPHGRLNTLTAAWFTHKDFNNPDKARLWDSVAEQVDLRLTSAPMYMLDLERHGTTALVRPAVEREHFTPRKKHKTTLPVVGLSGYSYGDNRKGEDLVKRLLENGYQGRAIWKASGRGWAVRTKPYSWDGLPQFFQSLDILLCASRIEGVPMPPLEALACGVRVVIPRGVGLLDELPDAPGVYRFRAGDYNSLCSALDEALQDGAGDKDALRALTEPYTARNWARDHARAFEALLYPSVQAENLPDWRGRSGVYVVAFGEPSRKCAARCIQATKRVMPDVPVALVGSEPLGLEDVFIEQEDRDIGGRLGKLAVDRLAPHDWRYVLYLDADTQPVEPLDFLFNLLASGWEAFICKDMDKYHYAGMMKRPDNSAEFGATMQELGTEHVMQYNGGVFGFRRCENTRRFFRLWNEEYQRWLGRDQGALLRALHKNPLRLCVLTNHWNASTRYPLPPGEVALLHHNMEARRWARSINGRIDSRDAWNAVKEWETAHG